MVTPTAANGSQEPSQDPAARIDNKHAVGSNSPMHGPHHHLSVAFSLMGGCVRCFVPSELTNPKVGAKLI